MTKKERAQIFERINELKNDMKNDEKFKLDKQCTWSHIYNNIVMTQGKDLKRRKLIIELFQKVKDSLDLQSKSKNNTKRRNFKKI